MKFSRRDFLQASGLGLGLVPSLAATRGMAADVPAKRLIVITVPNGYTNDYVPVPTPGGWKAADVEFSPLSPLEPWKEKVLVMGGINIQNGIDTAREVKKDPTASIGGHAILPFLLTGAKGVSGPPIPDGWQLTASHASVDQYVVQNMPGARTLPFPSLVLRPAKLGGGYGTNPLSYHGKTKDGTSHNAPTVRDNPLTLFAELFAGATKTPEVIRLRAKRKSVLDFAASHLQQLQTRVGTDDKARLDQHLEGVRRIEKQLDAAAMACVTPIEPNAAHWVETQSNPQMHHVMRAQIDMTIAAMACDLTRVASFSWCQSNNNTIVFPWLADRIPSLNDVWDNPNNAGSGNNLRNHHTIAHNDGMLKREKNLVDQFFIESFAYVIERLAATKDPNGAPLLDNTLVLYANQQRTGGGHQTDNVIWHLAGNANGYFKTGRYLPWVSGKDKQSAPTNGILTAIVNAMGCPHAAFYGDPAYGGELLTLKA